MQNKKILEINRLLSYAKEAAGLIKDYDVEQGFSALIKAVEIIKDEVLSEKKQ